jgi:hypothetical protein
MSTDLLPADGLLPRIAAALSRGEERLRFPETAALGALGTLLVAVGGTLGGSPFDLRQAGAWFFGMASDSTPARLLGAVALYVGLVVSVVAWLQLVRLARSEPVRLRQLAVVFVAWVLPLIVAPPLFSRDAYSYAADGQMAAEGVSPYRYGPLVLADPAYVEKVSPIWQATPTPYGPLFVAVAEGDMDATGHGEVAAIELLRLEAVAGVVLAGVSVADLAGRAGYRPHLAVTLAVLNPVTLYDLVSPGHNDALMMGFLLAGLAAASRGKRVAGLLLCAVGAAIKAPALIGAVYIGWHWQPGPAPWRRRGAYAAGALGIAAVVLGVVSEGLGFGWSWLWNLGTPAIVHSVTTPTTAVADLVSQVGGLVGLGGSGSLLLAFFRAIGLLAAAAACAWCLWRSRASDAVWYAGLSLLAVAALSPTLQPWYVAWGVMAMAALPGRGTQRTLMAVSAYMVVATIPDYEPLLSSVPVLGPAFAIGVAALCALSPTDVPGQLAARLWRHASPRVRLPG